MDIEVTTRKVEKKYVTIGGKEVPAAAVIDFIDKVEGTDSFNAVQGTVGVERDAGEALQDEGLVGHSQSRGFYSKDDDSLNELREQILKQAYDE